MNLQCSEPFLTKVLQLYDTTVVRHGLMLVGPAGAGKTMNYKVLAKACSKLGDTENYEKVILDILNPKSITKDSMYGFVDPATQEWNDGVLPIIVMACCRDETVDKHWIMFDGPVDAVWIEDMNTVLDDNKKLCLNSGQIIQLTPHMTMMFEVADLLVASPATVSRCGMVYMEPESLTLWPLVISWLNTLPEKVKTNKFIKDTLTTLMQNNLADACYFVRKNLVEPVATMDNNIASSLMRLISCFMTPYVETEIKIIS
jgi:dynein heavy chain